MDLGNVASLRYFGPELLLTAAIVAIALIDLVVKNKSRLGDLALIVSAGALLLIGTSSGLQHGWLFNRMLIFDSFAVFFRALIAIAVLIAIWMSMGSREVSECDPGEYYTILLSATYLIQSLSE